MNVVQMFSKILLPLSFFYLNFTPAFSQPCITTVLGSESQRSSLEDVERCCCGGTSSPCSTLTSGLSCTSNYSNSILYLNGTHFILPTSQTFKFVENVSIIGVNNYTEFHSNKKQLIIPEMSKILVECTNPSGVFFENVSNITLINVHFSKCGITRNQVQAALVFINSFDITLTKITLSNGSGFTFLNTGGNIYVTKSTFLNNTNVHKGGGGSFEFTSNFESECQTVIKINNSFITNNKVEPNKGKGGGMYFSVASRDISVFVKNTFFTDNSAQFGSGIYIEYLGKASGNRFNASNSNVLVHPLFDKKNFSRGGGVRIEYNTNHTGNNLVIFSNTRFSSNIASVGGGLSLVSNHIDIIKEPKNAVYILHCHFTFNIGIMGSAIHAEAFRDAENGYVTSLILINCSFTSNMITHLKNHSIGMGIVYVDKLPLILKETNKFIRNDGTGLAISATAVHFSVKSITNFQNNHGYSGGAINLINSGYMVVHNQSDLKFDSNYAVDKGGAITVLGYGELNLRTIHQRSCFIKYMPDNALVTLTFQNNSIKGKPNSVYLPSSMHCFMSNGTSLFCGNEWVFENGNCTTQLSTSVAYMKQNNHANAQGNDLQTSIYPGIKSQLPISLYNDQGQDVTSSTPLIGFVPSPSANLSILDPDSYYISDGYYTMYKKPEAKNTDLHISTFSSTLLYTNVKIDFLPCPPGYEEVHVNISNSTDVFVKCSCGKYNGVVKCYPSQLRASINDLFCMSYIEHHETYSYLTAQCQFTQQDNRKSFHYLKLPKDPTKLSESMCGKWNRTGLFCSECLESMGVNVASWIHYCIKCSKEDVIKNWVLYLVAISLPITLLFLIIVLFSINLTSGSINMYIFYCQALSLPENIIQFESHFYINATHHGKWLMVLFSPFTIWNLDFLETFIPPFCLSPHLKLIHIIALKYVTATFPLLLIAISYVLIELHARGFRFVVWLWKPFSNCFRRFRNSWNIKQSIIDVFAAFILLSYTKFTSITFNLLMPNRVYNSTGHVVDLITLADGSIKYGSSDHRVYLLLSIAVLIMVILPPPIFLLIYPCNLFQKCLRTRRQLALMTFVEAFQGCFKDGTNGTRDCRYFAALYFLMRILGVISRFFSWNLTIQHFSHLMIINAVILIILWVQPYKKNLHNQLDVAIMLILNMVVIIAMYYSVPSSAKNDSPGLEFFYISVVFTPPFCLGFYLFYKLLKKIMKYAVVKCRNRNSRLLDSTHSAYNSFDSSLPDRLVRPDEYNKKDED